MNRRAFLTIPFEDEDMPCPEAEQVDTPIFSMPTASYPRDYARHTWVLIQDVHAWLNRDELGFYALDAACPHLGCVIRAARNHFVCPCHKSSFASSGDILSGPAQTRLRYLRVDLNADGKLIICRDQVVSPDDRFIA